MRVYRIKGGCRRALAEVYALLSVVLVYACKQFSNAHVLSNMRLSMLIEQRRTVARFLVKNTHDSANGLGVEDNNISGKAY